MKSVSNPNKPDIQLKINKILENGQLTVAENLELVNLLFSDDLITDQERFYINRVFDELKLGHLTIKF